MDETDIHMDQTASPSSQFSVLHNAQPGRLDSSCYHFVFSGPDGCSLKVDGRQIWLVDRQVAALSPGEEARLCTDAGAIVSFRHEFFCVKVSRAEVFCDGIVFNRISAGPVITMPRDEWDIVASRIVELERIDRSASPLRVERLVGCLRALLLACADARLLALDLPAAGAGPSPEILAFQDALEASFLEHPNADTLARTCGIPTSRLMRLVKEELGMTVNQAVGERLAIEARQRLRTGDVSVKGVCYALGFSDPLYFSRFFKQHFGASPTTFFAGHAAAD